MEQGVSCTHGSCPWRFQFKRKVGALGQEGSVGLMSPPMLRHLPAWPSSVKAALWKPADKAVSLKTTQGLCSHTPWKITQFSHS